MKIAIGQWNVTFSFYSAINPKIELVIDTDQEKIKAAISISYWHGAENPLVIKGELKTEDKSNAPQSIK